MKKITFLFAFIVSLNLYAQLNIKTNLIPNCIPVRGDYLFLKETEVSNLEYKEFIQWLISKGDTAEAKNQHPDTLVWIDKMTYYEPFVHYYYQHQAYNNYPVVGISQSQATNYCIWLRSRLLEKFKSQHSPIQDIIVRLPTEKEWMNAARIDLDNNAIFPWEGESPRITKGRKRNIGSIRLNCKSSFHYTTASNEIGFITTPVYAFWPSKAGFYNLSGNVAEWVYESGKTKGGSWALPLYYSRIDVNGFEDGSSDAKSDVGFRFVVEIVKITTEKPIHKKISASLIEKEFSQIDSNSFAGKYEVTNQWFNSFIQETGLTEYTPQDSLWLNRYNPYHYRLMYSSFDNTKDFPVVNISHNAAQAYCKWLTEKYNSFSNRKYHKVLFHLPDEYQWYKAAAGGRINNSYPWGGPYIVNSKGEFLANFFPLPVTNNYIDSSCPAIGCYSPFDTSVALTEDGYEFTTNVKSFQPNGFGLYNMSGNAAEMLNDGKKVMGGSWNSNVYYLQLHNPAMNYYEHTFEKYDGPSPFNGFRIFMSIIEK